MTNGNFFRVFHVFHVLYAAALLLFAMPSSVFSQEIITAGRYLEMVSEKYANMTDYESAISIQSAGSTMTGTVSFRVPSFLRIDFTAPAEQVVVFDGSMLTLYLPEYRATMMQKVSSGRSSGEGLGLRILRQNYTPSYVTGPAPVALEGTGESVVQLRLTRRSSAENYREIILSVNPSNFLIRRMDGITLAGGRVRFDFSNVKINQGIPTQRFEYDSPPSANVYNNFMFRNIE
jgi:outer membrane lipoprotein-sorting protein